MTSALAGLAALGSGGPASVHERMRESAGVDPVSSSPELRRIRALPRRAPDSATIEEVESWVRKPGGTMRLRPKQAQALWDLKAAGGLFAPIAVGGGKTLLAVLAATVLDVGPAVVLTNAGLVKQARQMILEYAEHFRVRRDLRWLSYGLLSSPKQYAVLERLDPKLLVLDECQAVANPDAARTKRLERFLAARPGVVLVAMSGTITRRSIRDYSKLLKLCLKDRTPLPRDWKTTQEWAEALDVSDRPRPPGALVELCEDAQLEEFVGHSDPGALKRARMWIAAQSLKQHRWESEEASQVVAFARDTVRRRVTETLGVVSSTRNDQEAGLSIEFAATPEVPEIDEALERVADLWERPDGELLTFALELSRVVRHVRLGGYYRWVWPKAVEREAREAWLLARREYRAELREFLKGRSREGLDSPYLVEQAIKRGEVAFEHWSAWEAQRAAMKAALGAALPPTEWVWISKGVVEEVRRLVEAEPRLCVWTDTSAVGREIARCCCIPWYGAGEEAQRGILGERGDRAIALSIKAHGTGRNLQAFSEALVVGGPPSGATWEQLLGRLHRPGQEAEIVRFRLFDSFRGELRQAVRDAEYIQQSTGNEQKLLTAEIAGREDRAWINS